MANKSNRVLVFTTAFRPMIGGSEIALEEIVNRLPDIFFDIITPRHKNSFSKTECYDHVCVHRVGVGFKGLDKLLFPVLGFVRAIILIGRNNYDKSHAYQASYGGGAAWLLKLFYPALPFVLTLQEGKNLAEQNIFIKFFRRLIIKKADVITGISNYLADYAKKINKRAKVTIIPNGVDVDKFKDENLNNGREKTIITVSRLVEKNGVGDLIDAFEILNSKFNPPPAQVGGGGQNSKLLIVGEGPLKESLKFKVRGLKLEGRVVFVGEVLNSDLSRYLSQADIFVRPSLSEGLGTAFLEAMAAGVPIIGTPVGGIPDFLRDGETGLFCSHGDPEDIAAKINLLLSDVGLREKLTSNARKLVEEQYDWNKIALKFKEVYLNGTF